MSPDGEKEVKLVITPGGRIRLLYDDDLLPLMASHVEPAADGGRGWTADMTPVAPGVVLGPFPTRTQALQAEIDWLTAHGLAFADDGDDGDGHEKEGRG